jgi:hypothetical protein
MCGCRRSGGGGGTAAVPVVAGVPLQTRTVSKTMTITKSVSGRVVRRNGGVTPTYIQTTTTTIPLDVVDTRTWGPHMWIVLHVLSLRAPPAAWANIPAALDGALPCPDCRTHFHDWVVAQPLTASGDGPRDWVAALHNSVNERLGLAAWTIDEMLALYGPKTKADAVAALAEVRGMIGSVGLTALDALVAATS